MKPEVLLPRLEVPPPPVPILSQINPVHVPASYFLMIHFNIIFPSAPGSWLGSILHVENPSLCLSVYLSTYTQ